MIINSDRPRFASAPSAAAWHLYSSPIDDQHPKISKNRGNVGRLVALLRDGPTISMDIAEWTNDWSWRKARKNGNQILDRRVAGLQHKRGPNFDRRTRRSKASEVEWTFSEVATRSKKNRDRSKHFSRCEMVFILEIPAKWTKASGEWSIGIIV